MSHSPLPLASLPGDSYIFLATTKKGPSLVHAIHFWLGSDSSQDEQGVAAYKSVELDGILGGGECRL